MRIGQTGTYVDRSGNSWWYRAGHELPDAVGDGLTFVPETAKEGAPENRALPSAPETRAGDDDAPKRKRGA